ncbi:MAG: transporter substrate-binding domain-containing protein [Desulfobacterales bacterium]|nr:transporter substrate-binding domain-containing protein [Desulfobacterales bacterium]
MRHLNKSLLMFACMWTITFSGTLWAQTITLAVGEWAPYTSKTDESARLAQNLVTKIFAQAGIEVKYVYVPWKRAYNLTKDGKYDGTFPWYRNDERIKDFRFPKEPLIKEAYVFFHLKNSQFEWDTLDDLKTYKIGVMSGEFSEKLLSDHGVRIESISDGNANFKKILSNRIEAYTTSKLVGYHAIQNMFPPEKVSMFTNHPKPLKEGEMFIMFSKSVDPGVIKASDEVLTELKASGKYEEILNR